MVWDPKVYATYKLWEAPDIEQKLRNVLRSLLLDVRRSFLQADVGLGNEGFAMQALLRRAMEDKCDVVVLLEPTVSLTPRWLNPLVAALASDTAIAAVAPINNQLGFREYPKMTTVLNEPDVRDKEGNALESAPLDEMARLAFLLSNNSVISVTELEGFVTAFPFDMLQREFFMMQIEKVLWRAVAQGLQTFLERLLEVSYQILLVPKSYVHVDNIQPPALQPEVEIAIDMNAGGAITLVRPTKMVRPNYTWHCRPLVMAKRSFTTHLATSLSTDKKFRVLFVLNKMSQKPDFVMRGGWISIVQECLGLALHNVHVRMAIPSWTMAYFEEAFPEAAERKIFLPFAGTSNNKIAMELIQRKEAFDFLVATLFTTVSTVEKLHAVYPNSIKSYYVQDIENHFDQGLTAMAESTYRRMVDGFVFVKTKYLENELRKTYGVKAQVIPPTVDTDRFNPNHRISSPADTLTACGMVRTSTPRRNPFGTYKVLASALARHGPDKLKVIVFGSTLEELQRMLELHGEDTTFPAGLEFLGNLNRAEVASILHKCDLFLDFSEWQAFGRSGLECMAAGCIPILPLTGGSSEYAVHGRNAFLLNSSDVEAGVKLIDQVLYNTYDIGRMREAAVTRAARFSIPRSGKITSDLFGTVLAKKRRLNSFLKPSNVIPC
uniref:Glycosyl transferase family 1 domain-containing protein n=1 Tax=Picocystis salinarum TaxID=88271 RepID=A0A7S3UIN6_9CHLO